MMEITLSCVIANFKMSIQLTWFFASSRPKSQTKKNSQGFKIK